MTTTVEFWHWFSTNAERFTPNRITNTEITELQQYIDDAVGDVDWEIGPAGGGQAFFALSPWTLLDGELGTEKSRSLVGVVTVSKTPVEGAVPLKRGLLVELIAPARD